MNSSAPTGSDLAAVFGRAASTFGGMGNFIFFGDRLVARAEPRPGDRILDVATGRGAVAFHAAKRVGATGHVLGIDIAEGMLQETTRTLANGQWPMIELRKMDAQSLDLPEAAFDQVLCGFALWFFKEPARALIGFRRVLKSRGRLAVSTIAHDSPYHRLLKETLRPHLAAMPNDAVVKLSSFDTVTELEAAFAAAGFVGTRVASENYEAVAPNAEAMWHHLWSTSHRRHLEGMPPAALRTVKSDYFARLAEFSRDDGIHLVWRALIAVGEKAD